MRIRRDTDEDIECERVFLETFRKLKITKSHFLHFRLPPKVVCK